MTKKIAVLGTGANGSCAAADLTRAGHDVTLIDQWPAHVEKMKADSLTINMPNETLQVKVRAEHMCDVCGLNEKYDVVFLCVKAFDTRWMAEFIRPYLADDGLLIGVQNGMTAQDIAEIVGPERTLGCVVELSSEIFDPGIVKRNTVPDHTWFGIGALDPSMKRRLPEILEILSDVGKVEVVDNILSAKWMKLVINAMTMGIKGIVNMTSGEIFKVPGMRDLMLRAGEESLVIGHELGYKNVAIIGLKPEDIEGTNRFCELMLDKITADVGPGAKVTVLQDHLKGRYSEVDQINGYVAEESEKRGLKAPVNRMVAEITKRKAMEMPAEPMARRRLHLAALQAVVKAYDLMAQRQRGDLVENSMPAGDQLGPRLSEAFDRWKLGVTAKGGKKPARNTILEAENIVLRFKQWHGDWRLGSLPRHMSESSVMPSRRCRPDCR